MRKFFAFKITLLFIILLSTSLQVKAKDIYVQATGGSTSGEGTIDVPVGVARLTSILSNPALSEDDNELKIYFKEGTYNLDISTVFNNTAYNGASVTFDPMEGNSAPVIFDRGGSSAKLINMLYNASEHRTEETAFSLSINNIIFQNYTGSTSDNFITLSRNYNSIELESVTIQNTSGGRLIIVGNGSDNTQVVPNSYLKISNSSIINNNRTGNMIYLQSGNTTIYNTTISDNTVTNKGFYILSGTNNIINNTIYNSGSVGFYRDANTNSGGSNNSGTVSSSLRFINNIVVGPSSFVETIGGLNPITSTNTQYNIIKTSASSDIFYCNNTFNGGVNITTGFGNQFNINRTNGTDPGMQYHDLSDVGNSTHVILRKGMPSSILSDNANLLLENDQIGNRRPSGSKNMSVGAIDIAEFNVNDWSVTYSYIPGASVYPPAVYDLGSRVELPPGITLSMVNFQIVDQTGMTTGNISLTGSSLTYNPTISGGEVVAGSSTFSYKVSYQHNAILYEKTAFMTITNKNIEQIGAPGYVEPNDFSETCYDQMGTVAFTSSYRFKPANGTTDIDGTMLHDFTIPLVADLDRDGYPEIIGISTYASSSSSGRYNGIQIYNGQTGKVISRLLFGTSENQYFSHAVSHGPPTILALADVDRDGIIEAIFGFQDDGSSALDALQGKVACYKIIPNKSGNVTTSYKMNRVWVSSGKYNTGGSGSSSFQKPITQLVDIDGDGTPEVIVYNKIYDAVTGKLLATLGTLTTTTTNNDIAHVGVDHNANRNDGWNNFSFIYDMDQDGIYDFVGGGKVYKLRKNSTTGSFEYDVVSMSNVPDGRTGVADINGDGIPDVVSIRKASSSLRVTVWNPGFYQMSSKDHKGWPVVNQNGEFIRNTNAEPYIMADYSFVIPNGSAGSNSYVYIGDIDGKQQAGPDGKLHFLPEIAILGGEVTTSNFNNMPKHPLATGGFTGISRSSSIEGFILGFTWDYSATATSNSIKLSFALEHKDRSANTGFTMFDFDNDGIQEICYRDESTLRIIKASKEYIKYDESSSNVILFRTDVRSSTGFEYPVIADIDNDASAEMVVVGRETSGDSYRYWGYMYAVGNGSGDKFAPALPVWNQFMYSPFKINPKDLTTPVGPAPNPLSYKFNRKVVKNGTPTELEGYQPYNNTLGQAFYHETYDEQGKTYMEPIVFLTESYIVSETSPDNAKRPKVIIDGSNYYIEITIGNKSTAKTDISVQTPISIYNNTISSGTYLKTVRLTNLGVTSAIKAGEEHRIRISIPDPYTVYRVRLGDDSGNAAGTAFSSWKFGTNNGTGVEGEGTNPPVDSSKGIGIASRAYRDCDWRDQTVKASLISVNSDAVTVQSYNSVLIDIFANDEYPSDLPSDQKLVQNVVKTNPIAGSIVFSNNRIVYTHDGSSTLPNNIDSFRYEIKYKPSGGVLTTFTAMVYIYILESESGGFAACYGDDLTTQLKKNPDNIRFLWNSNTNQIYPTGYTGGTDSLTIDFGPITTSKTYHIKPLLAFYNNENVDFSPGVLTVGVLGQQPGDKASFKWTGSINTNWHDPQNWVEIKNGREIPVLYIPTGCVNVIIPSGLKNYPQLTAAAQCATIKMNDRAMIAGINYLTYDNAEVELKMTSQEKNRFIMWSPPLKDTYTGDYHFTKTGTADYYWGDVYMNFFQQVNPDNNGAAVGNHFTATFGNIWTKLQVGQPINLKVISTTDNSSKMFTFPKPTTLTSYVDANGKSGPNGSPVTLTRPVKGRFISDDVISAGNTIPVPTDMAESNYIQVVNPFMAYLKVREFLVNNSTEIEQSYKIWNGVVSSTSNLTTGDLITIKPDLTNGQRYIIDNLDMISDQTSLNAGLIPPLQSFFVKKASTGKAGPIKMNPAWTTTINNSEGSYQLRAELKETNTLRIKATQNNTSSSAVLFYHPESSPNYKSSEDAYKLFYSEAPLAVYTFSPSNDPLSVNSSNDFTNENIRLGMRVENAGQITFDFTGLANFGHNVWLIDHLQNNKEIDLQVTPTYTFTVEKKSANDKMIELNDRFSLKIRYTGIGLSNKEIIENNVHISANDGNIYIQSPLELNSIQVYNISGALVYHKNNKSNHITIPVERQQNYIVKINIREEYIVEKVFVK